MSFKEKSAWVMCVALSLGAWFYGYTLLAGPAEESRLFGMVVVYVLIIVAISIIGHIIAAVTSIDEAEAPSDERDRIISTRSTALSSHILGFGAIVGILIYLFDRNGDALFHCILASLTISAIVEYTLQIYFYRTGV